mmetsp:Transcript_27382/g.48412  ORF Transcript_27382/g.48412 Transcript_27382/m.48412 type:complete len:339 (-) Transcript_27382:1433-2449(-)
MAASDDRGLHSGLGLLENLYGPLLVVELGAGEHLFGGVQHDRDLFRHALGPEGEVADHRVGVGDVGSVDLLAEEVLDSEPARVGSDVLAELHGIFARGSRLGEHALEEGEERHVGGRESLEVERQVHVHDAGGGHRMCDELGSFGHAFDFNRNRLLFLLEVLEPKLGHGRHGLRRVLGRLSRLQRRRLVDDTRDVFVGELAFDGLQLLGFDLQLLLLERGVGRHRDSDPVRVLDEHLLDDVFEHRLLRGELRLELRQVLLEPQALDGVAPVNPAVERAEHEHQTLGVAAGVEFSEAELDRVHGGRHSRLWKALSGELGEGVHHQFFDLLGIRIRLQPL